MSDSNLLVIDNLIGCGFVGAGEDVFADLGLNRMDREIDVEPGGRPQDPGRALGVMRKGGVVRSLGLSIKRGQWTQTAT
jgi:hypothetical protein